MKPEFSRNYRDFSSAAKEAGFNDVDERKLAALDPDLLLEGTSETLRKRLTGEMLVNFFKLLQQDTSADDKQILAIGNLLYGFRSGKEHILREARSLDDLTEKELRLLGLACGLIENAFYKGNLLNLPDKQAAALAFTINVLAKIFEEYPANERRKGFNEEKLSEFIERVGVYRKEMLAPKDEKTLENEKKAILRRIEEAEAKKPAGGWEKYFNDSGLVGRLERARQDAIAQLSGLTDQGREWVSWHIDAVIKGIEENLPRIIACYEKAISEISNAAKLDSPPGNSLLNLADTLNNSLVATLVARNSLNWTLPLKGNANAKTQPGTFILDFEEIYRELKRQAEKSETGKAKKKSLQDIGDVYARMKLSEALNTLGIITEKRPEGLWGEYLEAYVNAAFELRRSERGEMADAIFMNSEKRILEQIATKSVSVTVPYLIKTCLIVDNKINSVTGDDRRTKYENELAFPLSGRLSDGSLRGDLPAHSFTGKRDSERPSYDHLHYMPDDMPFAVWALRYLRSNKAGQAKHSEKNI
ncbi:MAG: hypothetical protein PHU56_03645 [Candidatus Pacebacteria bacterium]|nr:hypothetical protein [Candidatus Paceibacterota bacterium]